jgi:hypothetical protein
MNDQQIKKKLNNKKIKTIEFAEKRETKRIRESGNEAKNAMK